MSDREKRRLAAEDYQYRLPDHWLLPEDNIWTMMHHAYVRRAVEIVSASGARSVIEVGCGDGWNCGQLVEAGLDVVGVDWSVNGIEHARRMVPGARFYCGDITDTAFLDRFTEPFDAAVYIEVIEHIPPEDCVSVLRGIRNRVTPGGTLVLTTPSVNFPNDNDQHYRHFTPDLLQELVDAAGGLRTLGVEGYGNVRAEDRHWARARFVDNRLYTLHRAKAWLNARYARHCLGAPLFECHGLILHLERTG